MSCVLLLTCFSAYETSTAILRRKKQNCVTGNLQNHIENNFPLLRLRA